MGHIDNQQSGWQKLQQRPQVKKEPEGQAAAAVKKKASYRIVKLSASMMEKPNSSIASINSFGLWGTRGT